MILETAVLTTEYMENTEKCVNNYPLLAHHSGEQNGVANGLFSLCELCVLCGELLF